MPSSFLGLNTAASGMQTYMAQLNTTAHNIANTETDGYTKQTVTQTASQALSLGTSWGMLGTGVTATGIESARNVYYDEKYRQAGTSYGYYSTLSYYLESIEDYFYTADDDTGGIYSAFDTFFEVLSNLTTDPSDTTIRQSAVGYADLLSSYVQEAASALLQLQQDANDQIAKTVDQINAYAEEIASLTKQINSYEAFGATANDLRDQRATLLDELSELVDIEVTEVEAPETGGQSQFIVTIDGMKLVDTTDYYTIQYVSGNTFNTQTDAEGMYTLYWSNGSDFDIAEAGGTLQALYEIRDGNNGEVFTGTITSADAGSSTITIVGTNDLATSLLKLNIPETDGIINIGSAKYQYESFTVELNEDGNYVYTFTLKDGVTVGEGTASKVASGSVSTATVGESVDYRGVSYYMTQLSEFVRTFSSYFNDVQTTGYDLNGDQGVEVFTATNKTTGEEMTLVTLTTQDAVNEAEADEGTTYYLTSLVDTANLDSSGASYYYMTALNFTVASDVLADGSLLACSDSDEEGVVANGGNLEKMLDLQNDKTMFSQGTPDSFLQVLTAIVGMDGQKAQISEESAENLKTAVNTRRLSETGVDEDEEAQNLIVFQNLLEYQYKVLSVMDEVLDKLINDTAV